MTIPRILSRERRQRGQTLPMFALLLPLLILFAGFALDVGFAYIAKASLSKAVDAAALEGMKNRGALGESAAVTVATNTFNANYIMTGRETAKPVPVIAFANDASGNRVINVSATSTINTWFIKLLPSYATLSVSANSQATKANLVMTLVLDRSGSMTGNGGAAAQGPAVTSFLANFDNAADRIGLVSFASFATQDVNPPATGFQTSITTKVNGWYTCTQQGGTCSGVKYAGATFSPGGISLGLVQLNSIVPTPGQNLVKVMVFFTDGHANTIQDNFICSSVSTLENYGGFDVPSTGYTFMDPATGNTRCSMGGGVAPSCCSNTGNPPGNQYFPSVFGGTKLLNQANIALDSEQRAINIANTMRTQGWYVYCIGLGNAIDQTFLQKVANDPASPFFDSSKPIGEAVFAPTAADLQNAYQIIATRILLRLTK